MPRDAERRPDSVEAAQQAGDLAPILADRARRRWRLDRQRHHRRVVKAFDRWAIDYYGPEDARAAGIRYGTTESACSCCCHASTIVDTGDYWRDMGFDLGMPERRAAGLLLPAEEQAA